MARSWQSRRHTERTKLPLVATPGSTEFAFDLLADAVAALPHRQRATLVLELEIYREQHVSAARRKRTNLRNESVYLGVDNRKAPFPGPF